MDQQGQARTLKRIMYFFTNNSSNKDDKKINKTK